MLSIRALLNEGESSIPAPERRTPCAIGTKSNTNELGLRQAAQLATILCSNPLQEHAELSFRSHNAEPQSQSARYFATSTHPEPAATNVTMVTPPGPQIAPTARSSQLPITRHQQPMLAPETATAIASIRGATDDNRVSESPSSPENQDGGGLEFELDNQTDDKEPNLEPLTICTTLCDRSSPSTTSFLTSVGQDVE
ncbi:hypothetical protein BKA56DRAFT_622103 [Ilyonectria sp. MPI-CAGE-AT-0026]|nr:hypothetical protein BKA56DRAFT_622103 [Ilyonectria sp. MPI-CAGE-AT-0026]